MELNEVVRAYNELSDKDKDAFDFERRRRAKEKENEEVKKRTAEYEAKYVGHCYKSKETHNNIFPEMWRYYKVLNFRYQGNLYIPEVLTFLEYPTYWFNYQASKMGQPGDYFLGKTDFDSGFEVVALSIFGLPLSNGVIKTNRQMQEISLNEFNDAARLYTERLLKLKFAPDHNRSTNILPGTEKWYKE